MAVSVRVQTEPFDPGALTNALTGQDSRCGAIASFVGQVRGGDDLVALELEHYPGVTEQALGRIADAAVQRWSLGAAMIVHRVGRMEISEPIVFVAAAAPHRRAALEATGFMIDILKTQAPFWKREYTATGSHWVEPRAGDDEAAAAWLAGSKELTA
ncbi:molybdenum cofactor biosynthesis protein MoaE [uncultured Maricaulis sp.]|uniref:molybdenum cofactor biosynthesis protein MoaE n=1 Tax=uncultured Maricaulis sp. TaxID=174710 RepID=UPI0030DD5741|tara:strand:- start:10754 stop:11224 length:471 start_codon:yes stop_codon:yes gene_type:complete